MTTLTQIFDEILALDSYNRGYLPGLTIPGSTIKKAKIISPDDLGIDGSVIQKWETDGFYASIYALNGQIVISYRGTDWFGIFQMQTCQ